MGQLVMRSYYVDAEVEQKLDQHAWRNKSSKAEYLQIATAFMVSLLEQNPDLSPSAFETVLDSLKTKE